MSKRNKRKNNHKFQSAHKKEGQSSEGVVEAKSVTLDEKIDDLALQSIKVPSTDMAETTIAKADDVAPEEVKKEEKATTQGGLSVSTEKKSNKVGKAFVWGLLLGALISSILF